MTSILFHSLPAAALADEHPFWKQEKFKKFISSPKSPKSICWKYITRRMGAHNTKSANTLIIKKIWHELLLLLSVMIEKRRQNLILKDLFNFILLVELWNLANEKRDIFTPDFSNKDALGRKVVLCEVFSCDSHWVTLVKSKKVAANLFWRIVT